MKAAIHTFMMVVIISTWASLAVAQTIRIDLGTVAPQGSPWHDVLLKMKQDWEKAAAGKVTLRIHAGAIQGDETEKLRKARQGSVLQAVALSGAALGLVDTSVSSLQIPMLIDSYAELDYIRARMEPKLEKAIEAKGFVVLNWSDVGWVHFFAKKQARTPDDIRALKLFTTAGDPDTEQLYKDLRFRPVPSGADELVTHLQTGFLEAFDVPPLFALLNQSFGIAKYMIDMKWAPLIAATLINRTAWEKIPESIRPELMRIARKAGDEERTRIRRLGDEAVVEMSKRGLQVVRLTAAETSQWRSEVEAAYPKMKGKIIPADLFDEVVRLSKEFRAKK
jgi:TRAP-type C4-dicarboxylate transport system substrate-binding protein